MSKLTRDTLEDVTEILMVVMGAMLVLAFFVIIVRAAHGQSVPPPTCPPVQQFDIPMKATCRNCVTDQNNLLVCRGCLLEAKQP